MNIFLWTCGFLFLLCSGPLRADGASYEPLFVPLGSTNMLTAHLRKVGCKNLFPFDKLLVTDGASLISLIKNDFAFFLDKEYLHQDLNFISINYRIINTYYNIEFRYDWDDLDNNFEEYLPKIQKKYQKLIDNFRRLDQHRGKVYFVRSAYPAGCWINPNFYLPKLSNSSDIISDSHAKELKEVLCQKFPHLDFELIIINYAELSAPPITGLDKVIEFKIRGSQCDTDFLQLYKTLRNR